MFNVSKRVTKWIAKPSDVYPLVLKWFHDDYSSYSVGASIKSIGEERIAEAAESLLNVGHSFIREILDKEGNVITEQYEKLSAFILYHWDGTFTLRRSLINALCNFYNTALVLLRCSMDMLFQGLLFQCLSQKRYRESKELQQVLSQTEEEKIKELKRLVAGLKGILNSNPKECLKLEKTSAYIFDLLEQIHKPRPEIRPTYKILAKWGLFNPIKKPEEKIAELYGKLSFNAHEHISTTDIGRAIMEGAEIFEVPQPFLEKSIYEYLNDFKEVVNLWTISEQNLIKLMLEKGK